MASYLAWQNSPKGTIVVVRAGTPGTANLRRRDGLRGFVELSPLERLRARDLRSHFLLAAGPAGAGEAAARRAPFLGALEGLLDTRTELFVWI